jgi:hypothetical protein
VQGGMEFGHELVVAGGDQSFDGVVGKTTRFSDSVLDETSHLEAGT